ncbi:MAG: type II toxin-antitoxin system MqsA family antitoxin [Actinomycetota bacterium]|nr:type II toxin-antitoxin system MqsA family antitoxin [Actinomycetota bacterium]
MTQESKAPWTCSVCGAPAARWSTDPLPVEFREGTYAATGFTYEHCDGCGESLISARDMDSVQRVAVELARADLGRMTSDEIHSLRHELGLRQSDLEVQLGVGVGTVGRWERGAVLQTRMADNFMRVLWAHPELVTHSDLVARESRGPYRKRD